MLGKVLFLSALACMALAVPLVPCTFTATVRITLTVPNGPTTEQWIVAANVEGQRMATINMGPRGNETNVVIAPYTQMNAFPFFDRQLCYIIATQAQLNSCPIEVPQGSRNVGKTSCRNNYGLRCSVWSYTDPSDSSSPPMLYYITPDSRIDAIIIKTAEESQYMDFINFDPSMPDDSLFGPPTGAHCRNFISPDESNSASFELSEAAASTSSSYSMINDKKRIEQINAAAKTWVAKEHAKFHGVSIKDFSATLNHVHEKNLFQAIASRKPMKMEQPRPVVGKTVSKARISGPLPTSFDATVKWPNQVGPIRDQGQCGSCWAVSGSSTLGDRFGIAMKASSPLVLSPQYLVDCFVEQSGCNGGMLDTEWWEMMTLGTVTEDCYPYQAVDMSCPSTCNDYSTPFKLYKAKSAFTYWDESSSDNTVRMIQQELMTNGPIEVAFLVFSDFMSYGGGIYTRTSDVFEGGHAVRLVGWGVDNGVPFWKIANSWGPDWGEQGFFRILRGANECIIEEQIATGLPLLNQSNSGSPPTLASSTGSSQQLASKSSHL